MMTNIVIVDDEVGVLNALKRSLRNKGWRIQTFSDPSEALRFIASEEVDLVISDYRMPEMNGVTLLQEVMAVQPDAVRMVLSGQADMNGVLAAINKAEIFRFITKPWSDAELICAIEQGLSFRRVYLENRRLANLVREQQVQLDYQKSELERLEQESPGITQIEFDDEGAIVVDLDDYDR